MTPRIRLSAHDVIFDDVSPDEDTDPQSIVLCSRTFGVTLYARHTAAPTTYRVRAYNPSTGAILWDQQVASNVADETSARVSSGRSDDTTAVFALAHYNLYSPNSWLIVATPDGPRSVIIEDGFDPNGVINLDVSGGLAHVFSFNRHTVTDYDLATAGAVNVIDLSSSPLVSQGQAFASSVLTVGNGTSGQKSSLYRFTDAGASEEYPNQPWGDDTFLQVLPLAYPDALVVRNSFFDPPGGHNTFPVHYDEDSDSFVVDPRGYHLLNDDDVQAALGTGWKIWPFGEMWRSWDPVTGFYFQVFPTTSPAAQYAGLDNPYTFLLVADDGKGWATVPFSYPGPFQPDLVNFNTFTNQQAIYGETRDGLFMAVVMMSSGKFFGVDDDSYVAHSAVVTLFGTISGTLPYLRMTQRDDGLGIARHPRIAGLANGASSRQKSRSPRVGTSNTYR